MHMTGALALSALTEAQRGALGMLFLVLHDRGVLAVEIFWGLWLLPFGILVIRSGFLPRTLGVLLLAAGVAWAPDERDDAFGHDSRCRRTAGRRHGPLAGTSEYPHGRRSGPP
jgi:hypothetical protein